RQTAVLLRALDDGPRAEDLERRAAALRARFERDFWSEELGCYVLARQAGGRPVAQVTSNAGQVLWGGIAAPARAARVAARVQPAGVGGGGDPARALEPARPAPGGARASAGRRPAAAAGVARLARDPRPARRRRACRRALRAARRRPGRGRGRGAGGTAGGESDGDVASGRLLGDGGR